MGDAQARVSAATGPQEREVPAAAHDQDGLRQRVPRVTRQALDPILADADQRQPGFRAHPATPAP